jgi:hypothetical protein
MAVPVTENPLHADSTSFFRSLCYTPLNTRFKDIRQLFKSQPKNGSHKGGHQELPPSQKRSKWIHGSLLNKEMILICRAEFSSY